MPIFYYVDFYYDPARSRFEDVVGGCVAALVKSGCKFRNIVMSGEGFKRQVSLQEHVRLSPDDIRWFAAAFAEEMRAEGKRFFSFPPMGRILFEQDFRFDEALLEEVEEEEREIRTSARTVGLHCTFSEDEASGTKIKASLSLWEEYVLTYGSGEKSRHNMARVLEMAAKIYGETGPYFGAMNNEIRINTDASLELLKSGRLPTGNEYVLVGKPCMKMLDLGSLKRSGCKWKALGDGGVIIQFEDKRK